MPTIQRPGDAATKLFWHAPPAPVPVATSLVVDPQDCVVASLNGAILGVIAPGTHSLDPQALPFLAPSVDASSSVTAELWFVRTSDFRGVSFGGAVGRVYDATTKLEVAPRVFGEYAMRVLDAPRLIQGCMSMADADALYAHVGGVVLRKMGEALARITGEGASVLGQQNLSRLMAETGPINAELGPLGLTVTAIPNLNINFSDEDRSALMAANAARAAEHRAAAIAKIDNSAPAPGVGVPVVAAPSGSSAPAATGGAAASPTRKGKGLAIGLGLGGVALVAVLIGAVMHFSHGASHEKAHDAPSREAKHGKH